MRTRLLTLNEVSDRLRCSKRTLYRIIEDGEIRALKVRGGLRVLESSLDDYVTRQIAKFELDTGLVTDDANC